MNVQGKLEIIISEATLLFSNTITAHAETEEFCDSS
jgi:hypothetical protein